MVLITWQLLGILLMPLMFAAIFDIFRRNDGEENEQKLSNDSITVAAQQRSSPRSGVKQALNSSKHLEEMRKMHLEADRLRLEIRGYVEKICHLDKEIHRLSGDLKTQNEAIQQRDLEIGTLRQQLRVLSGELAAKNISSNDAGSGALRDTLIQSLERNLKARQLKIVELQNELKQVKETLAPQLEAANKRIAFLEHTIAQNERAFADWHNDLAVLLRRLEILESAAPESETPHETFLLNLDENDSAAPSATFDDIKSLNQAFAADLPMFDAEPAKNFSSEENAPNSQSSQAEFSENVSANEYETATFQPETDELNIAEQNESESSKENFAPPENAENDEFAASAADIGNVENITNAASGEDLENAASDESPEVSAAVEIVEPEGNFENINAFENAEKFAAVQKFAFIDNVEFEEKFGSAAASEVSNGNLAEFVEDTNTGAANAEETANAAETTEAADEEVFNTAAKENVFDADQSDKNAVFEADENVFEAENALNSSALEYVETPLEIAENKSDEIFENKSDESDNFEKSAESNSEDSQIITENQFEKYEDSAENKSDDSGEIDENATAEIAENDSDESDETAENLQLKNAEDDFSANVENEVSAPDETSAETFENLAAAQNIDENATAESFGNDAEPPIEQSAAPQNFDGEDDEEEFDVIDFSEKNEAETFSENDENADFEDMASAEDLNVAATENSAPRDEEIMSAEAENFSDADEAETVKTADEMSLKTTDDETLSLQNDEAAENESEDKLPEPNALEFVGRLHRLKKGLLGMRKN